MIVGRSVGHGERDGYEWIEGLHLLRGEVRCRVEYEAVNTRHQRRGLVEQAAQAAVIVRNAGTNRMPLALCVDLLEHHGHAGGRAAEGSIEDMSGDCAHGCGDSTLSRYGTPYVSTQIPNSLSHEQ